MFFDAFNNGSICFASLSISITERFPWVSAQVQSQVLEHAMFAAKKGENLDDSAVSTSWEDSACKRGQHLQYNISSLGDIIVEWPVRRAKTVHPGS